MYINTSQHTRDNTLALSWVELLIVKCCTSLFESKLRLVQSYDIPFQISTEQLFEYMYLVDPSKPNHLLTGGSKRFRTGDIS